MFDIELLFLLVVLSYSTYYRSNTWILFCKLASAKKA